MRSESLLIFTILLIFGSVRGSGYSSATRAAETCPPENCLTRNKCETIWNGAVCPNSRRTCCSVVKPEYRTNCRHHGGECMDSCNPTIQHPAVDCPGQKCCALV